MLRNADYSWILPRAKWGAVVPVLAALTLTAIVGCGEDGVATYPVSGKVVYPDGSPLAGGVIELRCTAAPTPVTARELCAKTAHSNCERFTRATALLLARIKHW